MRYAVFSGPQGEENTFEGVFASTKEADIQVEQGEDNGSFYKIVDLELGLIYTSTDVLPEAELFIEKDYKVQLSPGRGVWVEVCDDKQDSVVVHIVCDRQTGMLRVEAHDPGKEDETPLDGIQVDF